VDRSRKPATRQVYVIDPDGDHPIKDILVRAQGAPTGSFLRGVGVHADAGLSGSIVLNERNSKITRARGEAPLSA
jgi:hypothetical protein